MRSIKVSKIKHCISTKYINYFHIIGQNVKTGDDVAIKLVSTSFFISPFKKSWFTLMYLFNLLISKNVSIGACQDQIPVIALWNKNLQDTQWWSWYTCYLMVWGRRWLQRYGYGSVRSKFRRFIQLLQKKINNQNDSNVGWLDDSKIRIFA